MSTAATCGVAKQGRLLRKIDSTTGKRIQTADPETGEPVDAIDDQLLEDVSALQSSTAAMRQTDRLTPTLRFVPAADVKLSCAVPVYYDTLLLNSFLAELDKPEFKGFTARSLDELKESGQILVSGGHASPSHEERVGEVPYIKVSDLRAGLVNINPTNRVPRAVAERYWRGRRSGLKAFDLVSPERTSKNIGDFCVLMPGQEQVVLTKEIIIIRPGAKAEFDPFYLLWALSLRVVRAQWRRVIFMQTNREDVGKRYLEIQIPIPPNRDRANEVSVAFREYYTTIANARQKLQAYLDRSGSPHHFFMGSAEERND
ncbi:MAG TPA: hypothetical protein VJS37_07985 [Terriglobales bacterium]|nr:hypothetical protein [Terriglobales bacterium]